MPLFSMYIFNRYGDHIYYRQWAARTTPIQEGEAGLVAGFTYTLQQTSAQLSSSGDGGLYALQTPHYKLHYFETMTGYRAVLLTDKDQPTGATHDVLVELFVKIFNPLITNDPTYQHARGVVIRNPSFDTALDAFLKEKGLQ